MNRCKRLISFLLLLAFCIPFVSVAAEEVVPCADSVFGSASAYLSASKSVIFNCTTLGVKSSISITSVWLEEKINGEWEYSKALTPPSLVVSNAADYSTVSYYSSDIGSGTFRVGFTVNADGHAISRYSNSQTY